MPSFLFLEVICILLIPGALPLQEVHVSRETIGKISAASKMMRCSAAVDILFLLDGSLSVGKGSFERAKHFAITVCDALDISPDRVRVGAFQFSSTPRLEFTLDSSSTQREVKTKIKRMVFKGGRTETGLALKQLLRGFPGGRNASVPQILLIVTDGRSQGQVALPAKQLKDGGVTVFAVGVHFPRWEELQMLASEPWERHVLMAEQVEDAVNGFFSALASAAICTTASPGLSGLSLGGEEAELYVAKSSSETRAAGPGGRRGGALQGDAWDLLDVLSRHPGRGSKGGAGWRSDPGGPGREPEASPAGSRVREAAAWPLVLAMTSFHICGAFGGKRPREEPRELKTTAWYSMEENQRPEKESNLPGVTERPCDSQPCQNGGTCVPEGLDRYHCLCPPAFEGEANCAPKLSLECRTDVLFLLASSAGTTPEGFLRAKAFVKRFVQATLSEDARARVGVARYSQELELAVPVGEYRDVPDLVRRLDTVAYSGGPTLTGSALQQAAERGFGTATRTGQDRPRRVVVLLTEARSQDDVAGPARHARARELLLLGVGSEATRAELEGITGSPKHVMTYAGPRDLFRKIPALQRMLCSRPQPGCKAQPLDLVFMLDASASVGPENFAQMQSFVRSCVLHFDVNPDVSQIGLVVYGSLVQTAFGLDAHLTRAAVLRAVSQAPYLGGAGSAGAALLHIHDRVMTVQSGARPGVPKAVVVLTGGRGVEDASGPAQKLRSNGVSVLVVGVGPVLTGELRRLAGPRDALIHVAAYEDLWFHQDALIEWLCAEAKRPVNLCRPSPCMNQGTCILRTGSYRCECRGGWEGPHCESRSLRGDAPGAQSTEPEEDQQLPPTQLLPRLPGYPGR